MLSRPIFSRPVSSSPSIADSANSTPISEPGPSTGRTWETWSSQGLRV
nr:hypothetical protein [Streptomyces sp. DSM 40971]